MRSSNKNEKPNIFRLLRIARNIQIKDLADELLVTPTYINAIENGSKYPSKRLLRDYARALDVDESVLETFDSNEKKTEKFENLLLHLLQIICNE